MIIILASWVLLGVVAAYWMIHLFRGAVAKPDFKYLVEPKRQATAAKEKGLTDEEAVILAFFLGTK